MVRYCVLFFIHIGTRKIHLGGITSNPADGWMRQAARNLTSHDCDIISRCRFLIRDRDTKFTAGFDMILRAAGLEPLALPARSPNLNAFAERFVRSIKEECLDRMIFFGEVSFRHAVVEYITHHQHERPHQSKNNNLLFPRDDLSDAVPRDGPVVCRRRLGGLLRLYHRKEAA